MKLKSEGEVLTQYHSMSISGRTVNYRPQQKNHQQERIIKYRTSTGKDIHCISYKKSTPSATQPMKNHIHLELSLFSNGLSFKTTLPNFFLFLYKIISLSFVGLAYSFAILLVLNVQFFAIPE